MEKPLERHVNEIMNGQGVLGVVCTDSQGLCLTAKGMGEQGKAGLISSIAQDAGKLNEGSNQNPVVVIETDTANILINSHNNTTTAVYKIPT